MLATMRGLRRTSRRPNWPFKLNRACSRAHGLVGWWPGNAGKTQFDLSPYHNHGASLLLKPRPGPFGGSQIVYDGTDAHNISVTTAAGGPLDIVTVSCAAWVNPTSTSANGGVVEKTVAGAVNQQFALFQESSAWKWRVTYAASAGTQDVLSTGAPVANTWTRLVGTYDSTTGFAALYINGRLNNSGSTAANPLFQGVGPLLIGELGSSAYPFTGGIFDVQVSNRVWTAAEVAADFAPATRWDLYAKPRRRVWVSSGGGSPYSIAVGSGSYAQTGAAAGLAYGRKLPAGSGSLAQAGSAVGLKAGHKVSVGSGAYAESGAAVALRHASNVAAGAGTYSETGTAVGLKRGYPLAAWSGAYTETGSAVALIHGRPLTIGTGSYTQTGTAVRLAFAHAVPAGSGAYTLTGSAVRLARGYPLAAGSGSYALSGTAVNLRFGHKLPAATGTYSLTGAATALIRGHPLVIGSGSYTVSGTAVAIRHASRVAAGSGSYSETGTAVALTYSGSGAKTLAIGAGSYTLTGPGVALRAARKMAAGAGAYTLTGSAVSLRRGYPLGAGTGSYSLVGSPVSLRATHRVAAGSGAYSLTGTSVALRRAYPLAVGTASYAATGSAVRLATARQLAADAYAYALAGADVLLDWSGAVPEIIFPGGTFRRPLWSWPRVFTRFPSTWPRAFTRPAATWLRTWRYTVTKVDPTTLTILASDDRDFLFDYSKSPELVAGAEIVSAEIKGGSGLTIGSATVSNAILDGIPAGKATVVEISGSSAGQVYSLACVATLDTGRKLTIPAKLVGAADY